MNNTNTTCELVMGKTPTGMPFGVIVVGNEGEKKNLILAHAPDAIHESDSFKAFEAGNARRLVACWNACRGLSTESIEQHIATKLRLLT